MAKRRWTLCKNSNCEEAAQREGTELFIKSRAELALQINVQKQNISIQKRRVEEEQLKLKAMEEYLKVLNNQ